MKQVYGVEFEQDSKEERLPGFDDGFPCITTCYEFRSGKGAPWHWHPAAELFYVESGAIEYVTPTQRCVFPEGWAGMVNGNVLHMTEGAEHRGRQLLHLFDPQLLAGTPRLEERYVRPLSSAGQVELIALDPREPGQREVVERIRESFLLSQEAYGYELRMRAALGEIWLKLLEYTAPRLGESAGLSCSEQLKQMLTYVHGHYGEMIAAKDLAAAACISERSCYGLFREYLHTTPGAYLQSYRLQMAKRLLAQSELPIARVAEECGFGSSSYFGGVFRKAFGLTPLAYRKNHRERKGENE